MQKEKASLLLDKIKDIPEVDKIDLQTLIDNNSESPYLVVMLVTVLVLAPLSFISNMFDIISVVVMYQVLTGRKKLTFPKIITKIKIKRTIIIYSIEKISSIFRKVEILTRNRMFFLTNKRFIDILLFIFSILCLSPVPFISFFSGMAIMFTIFGFLNKDGLFVLFGFLFGVINLFIHLMIIISSKIVLLKLIGIN